MKLFHPSRALLLVAILISSFSVLHSQEIYYNSYNKLNSGQTLKLAYIMQDEFFTRIYIKYLGNKNYQKFTRISLEDFKLVDRETEAEYKPAKNNTIPTDDRTQLFVFNNNEDVLLEIKFKRLPDYVRSFDLVDHGASGMYNFTFRDITLNPKSNDQDAFLKYEKSKPDVYGAMVYSYAKEDIKITINGEYVTNLNIYFTERSPAPDCGERGTVNFLTTKDEELDFHGSVLTKTYKLNWRFAIQPRNLRYGRCQIQKLIIEK